MKDFLFLVAFLTVTDILLWLVFGFEPTFNRKGEMSPITVLVMAWLACRITKGGQP